MVGSHPVLPVRGAAVGAPWVGTLDSEEADAFEPKRPDICFNMSLRSYRCGCPAIVHPDLVGCSMQNALKISSTQLELKKACLWRLTV